MPPPRDDLPFAPDPPVPAIPPGEFAPLVEALRAASRDAPLAYLPNPGNWGAAFTAAATRRFLAAHHIPYREIGRLGPLALARGAARREILLLGGGGAWSERFPGGRGLAARAARFFRRIVVLPSSFGMPVELRHASLWARDAFGSLRHAPAARFCPDLGFSLGRLAAPPPVAEVGSFFRGDPLGVAGRSAAGPDLSARGDHRSPVRPFLEEIARYREIRTDRVHVAIVACLLGRRCRVFPTATPMLADLFASSIAPHFPGATLAGPGDQNP